MKVIPFTYPDIDDLVSNCYVIIDENNRCVVIDPSVNKDGITNFINKNNLKLEGVLLTHAHCDHMGGVDRLINAFNTKLFVGFDDEIGLKDGHLNCSDIVGRLVIVNSKAITVADNDVLHLLDEDIKVIYTPYHTAGSVSYYLEKTGVVFTGDSLFQGLVGRSDLPTSKPRLMYDSLAKLMKLPDDVKVYPGHGRFTMIGNERKSNTFVKQ